MKRVSSNEDLPRRPSSSVSSFDEDESLAHEIDLYSEITPQKQSPATSSDSEYLASLQKRGLSPEQAYEVIGHLPENTPLGDRSIDYVTAQGIPFTNVTSSSGSSVVYLTEDKAYQFYDQKEVYEKVKTFPEHLPGFVKKISQHDNPRMVCWEKITPFKDAKSNPQIDIKKILAQAADALKSLHTQDMAHGDARLDNLGVNADHEAAWFDFDRFKKSASPEEQATDLDNFHQSLSFSSPETKKKPELPAPPPIVKQLASSPPWRAKSRQ